MKKLVILSLAILVSAVSLNAKGFGVKAGFNFNSMSDIKTDKLADMDKAAFSNKTGFHVGVLYKIDLPFGLAIQPELLYSQKGGSLKADLGSVAGEKGYDLKSHNLQLPVNVQWGLDLVLFRPFIMVAPYLSYAISSDMDSALSKVINWDQTKLGYGIGVGAGLDIWKFQVAGKYNWDLGKASEFKMVQNVGDAFHTLKGGKNRGFEFSLAFIF